MIKILSLLAIVGFMPFLLGCGAKAPEESKAQEKPASEEAHDHDHEHDDDHDHAHDHDDDHAHVHEAPHGGVLVELGDHSGNVEFLLGEDGTLTAFVLDAHAENPVRLTQMSLELDIMLDGKTELVSLDAVGNPLTGETPGDTSEFVAVVPLLAGKPNFEAVLKSIDYKGASFEGILFSYSPEKG